MLDELLGRARLKARIEELEAEVASLSGQLEGEQDRRREAVRDRQAADERVNRLEDRIADLEGQLERHTGEESAVRFRGTERLTGDRLRSVLDRLRSLESGPEAAFTAMVEGQPDEPTRAAFGDRAALLERAAPCLAVTDDAGVVSAALRPALPPDGFATWDDRFRIDPDWFLPAGPIAVALVRTDRFAYGEFEAGERVHVEGFDSDVMGSHSKGGFSQARFARRREEQVETHLDRCHEVLDERDPARLVVAGERTLLESFADRAIVTATTDASGDPPAAIDDAYRDVFSTTLYLV